MQQWQLPGSRTCLFEAQVAHPHRQQWSLPPKKLPSKHFDSKIATQIFWLRYCHLNIVTQIRTYKIPWSVGWEARWAQSRHRPLQRDCRGSRQPGAIQRQRESGRSWRLGSRGRPEIVKVLIFESVKISTFKNSKRFNIWKCASFNIWKCESFNIWKCKSFNIWKCESFNIWLTLKRIV